MFSSRVDTKQQALTRIGSRVDALTSNEHTPYAHVMPWNRTQPYTYHAERLSYLSPLTPDPLSSACHMTG